MARHVDSRGPRPLMGVPPSIPVAEPENRGLVWNDNGTLKVTPFSSGGGEVSVVTVTQHAAPEKVSGPAYTYCVTAFFADGTSTGTESTCSLTHGPTLAVLTPVTVSWTAVPNATGYSIYAIVRAGGNIGFLAQVAADVLEFVDDGSISAPQPSTAPIYIPNTTGGLFVSKLVLTSDDRYSYVNISKFDFGASTVFHCLGNNSLTFEAGPNYPDGVAGVSLAVRSGYDEGDDISKIRSNGPFVMTGMPTSDPHKVGQLWNSSGVVHISAG